VDSLTQAVLGAAVSVAVMQRRTAVWKAAAWGALAGTLPDLDVLLDHGDPVLNMVLHRAETHSLFWLTLLAWPLAALVAWVHGEARLAMRWRVAIWAALVTHPLLDVLTVYGTQLLLPFTDRPLGTGSVFIIDPAVTLPWLVGVVWALASRGSLAGLKANRIGLAVGTVYLAWGLVAQQIVTHRARATLAAEGVQVQQLLVTPAPLNTLLWRVVAVSGGQYLEGHHSLLDAPGPLRFARYDRGLALLPAVQALDPVRRLAAFTHGLWRLRLEGSQVVMSDLRMGQEPSYIFSFALARQAADGVLPMPPEQLPGLRVQPGALTWLWRRALGEPLPPPGLPGGAGAGAGAGAAP
jgi:inner membrane protein